MKKFMKKKLLNLLVLIHIPKSPGLVFEKAKATSGQAKAGAFRPSRAGTALVGLETHLGLEPQLSSLLLPLSLWGGKVRLLEGCLSLLD